MQEAVFNVHALLADLKSCTVRRDLPRGRKIHAKVLEIGSESNIYLMTALIKMYAKCGSVDEARQVFQSIHKPDMVAWTALILGYAENGKGCTALELFSEMKARGCAPNSVTYLAVLKACKSLGVHGDGSEKARALAIGRSIHSEIGRQMDLYVQNTLIDMYAKLNSMADARSVFDSVPKPRLVSWNALLSGYAQNGEGHITLQLFSKMKSQGCAPDSITYVAALIACTSLADVEGKALALQMGRRLHSEIGGKMNHYVQNKMIDMYAKCGSMVDAHRVFDIIQKPDVVSWNALLSGYADNGEIHVVLTMFSKMKRVCAPDFVTYIAIVKACTFLAVNGDYKERVCSLEMARKIEMETGCHSNLHLQSALVDVYAKCGSMVDARRVFDSIQKPDVVSWNALLLGYANNGQPHAALDIFCKLKAGQACAFDSVTYVAAFKACTSLAMNEDTSKAWALDTGRSIHSDIGCILDPHVKNTLIVMYAKCSSMREARHVFDSIPKPDAVSWTALLLGYAENGEGEVALELFSVMKAVCMPDSVTYVAVLKACTSLALNGDPSAKERCLGIGRSIHSQIGCHSDLYVENSLIDLYTKCGSMVEARRVFDSMQKHDVVSWNALLLGYADNGEGGVALGLFSTMKETQVAPNSFTYVALVKSCASLVANGDKERGLEMARRIHSETGEHLNLYVQNTLVDLYAKCGRMVEAHLVFDTVHRPDVVSWNTLVLGYAENGDGYTALKLYSNMKTQECVPDSATYVAVLKACTSLAVNEDGPGRTASLDIGRRIHSEIGCHFNLYVQNTLIDMYAKCGSMADASAVFGSIQKPTVVSWTALLQGYAENGDGQVALDLFSRMKCVCVPDALAFVAVFRACASVGALALGRKFHLEVTEFTVHLVTCLVDFYAKCGSLAEARSVFDQHPRTRDSSTWNALLVGYSTRGDTASVFGLFGNMRDEGLPPDAVTFLCTLLCCSHAGHAEKARNYLASMPSYGITPTVMHYTCVIDALGRANRLNEAVALLQKMPCNPDGVLWMTLLAACRKCQNVEIAKWAFESLMDMDTKNAPAYVVLAHIHGSQGAWEEQETVLQLGNDPTKVKLRAS